jgi:hypothetical protein
VSVTVTGASAAGGTERAERVTSAPPGTGATSVLFAS